MPEEIAGTVERVTFHNAENGFTVLRVRPSLEVQAAHGGIVTIVGRVVTVAEGESILARGTWREDQKHGRQFVADSIQPHAARGRLQIEAFLASGAIRGVGAATARMIYQHFGDKVFEILDTAPQRLRELPGIGPTRVRMIGESWNEQRATRELMLLLADSGIGPDRIKRIQKRFGPDAVRIVRENPYRLARDIRGIGFATADAVAIRLGLARDSIERIRAGAVHALTEASLQGHCGLPEHELIDLCAKLLAIPRDSIGDAIALELQAKRLLRDTIEDKPAIFLPWLFTAEREIARRIRRLMTGKPPWPHIDVEKAAPWVETKTGLRLAPSQRGALDLVLRSKVAVITGGPGVGKTTLVNSVLRILEAKDVDVLLAAPTGRAAKRLTQSTSRTAKTIHRLLEVDAFSGEFGRDEDNPLRVDLLILDEASMIDAPLMHAVVRALPSSAALLLVGDVDQLPAVGPGQVLLDLIESAAVPVVRLTEIFRQAVASRIIVGAHAINEGRVPDFPRDGDFHFVPVKDATRICERIVDLVKNRIPSRFGFDALRSVQVLAPMRKTTAGVEALNLALQAALNPNAGSGKTFYPGDKVMQTVNDYEKEVFNGDIGVIKSIAEEQAIVTVDFDGHEVVYIADEIDDVVLSYATTIHKSQGSEYPAVVIALTKQHSIMLQRNLLYTAVTRGKGLVVIVGEREAIRRAVQMGATRRRYTKLREWLRSQAI